MGLLDNVIGGFNPFRAVGKTIGTILIIIALVLAVPGILTLIGSSVVYGSPIHTVSESMATQPGTELTMNLTDLMTSGNNYDIKLSIDVDATDANPEVGAIELVMNTIKSGNENDLSSLPSSRTFDRENFNSTSFGGTFEMKDNFQEDADVAFQFTLDSENALTSIDIKIELYENPRRELSDLIALIGFILLIPSFILCCIGALISGSDEN